MKLKHPAAWGKIFLPKPKYPRMTWKRWLLLAFATALFFDQFFVHGVYGKSDDGIVFLILSFRAVSKSELPVLVLITGAAAAALTSAVGHHFLGAGSLFWAVAIGVLLLVTMFWHRYTRDDTEGPPSSAAADPQSVLHFGDK